MTDLIVHLKLDQLTLSFGVVCALLGGVLTVASFMMKNMLPLRALALAANVFFVAYGWLDANVVTFLLHVTLLPVNAKRTWDIHKLIRDIESIKADAPYAEWLVPHMTRRVVRAGEVLWRKGDAANEMVYVKIGTVRLIELNEELGPGTLLGEIGLFSPDNRRMLGLECVTRCVLYSLTAEGMYMLYYQNPKLGFQVMRLAVGRLQRDSLAARAAANPAKAALREAAADKPATEPMPAERQHGVSHGLRVKPAMTISPDDSVMQ